jgi:hypothetical protein
MAASDGQLHAQRRRSGYRKLREFRQQCSGISPLWRCDGSVSLTGTSSPAFDTKATQGYTFRAIGPVIEEEEQPLHASNREEHGPHDGVVALEALKPLGPNQAARISAIKTGRVPATGVESPSSLVARDSALCAFDAHYSILTVQCCPGLLLRVSGGQREHANKA